MRSPLRIMKKRKRPESLDRGPHEKELREILKIQTGQHFELTGLENHVRYRQDGTAYIDFPTSETGQGKPNLKELDAKHANRRQELESLGPKEWKIINNWLNVRQNRQTWHD